MADNLSTRTGQVIVQAGRRIDPADASFARFPLANVPVGKQRIKQAFLREKPVAFVSAAACGTDLIGFELAREMGIERVVLLPSPPADFRKTSVTDRPGDWGPMFDRLVREVHVEVVSAGEGEESYLAAN